MRVRHMNRTKYMHIENLEKITSHLNRPALIALAARPGVGKTTLAMNIAIYEAEHYNKNQPRPQKSEREICSFQIRNSFSERR